jgi:hypothetical protein
LKVEGTIEQWMNFQHPCIAGSIGIVVESRSRIMRIFEIFFLDHSLSEVISRSPEWWTPTVKAKVIVGVVFGPQGAHSPGLVHGVPIFGEQRNHFQTSLRL